MSKGENMDNKLLLTVKDVMVLLGVGRPTAMYYIEASGLSLPRRGKRGQYKVPREKFLAWIGGQK